MEAFWEIQVFQFWLAAAEHSHKLRTSSSKPNCKTSFKQKSLQVNSVQKSGFEMLWAFSTKRVYSGSKKTIFHLCEKKGQEDVKKNKTQTYSFQDKFWMMPLLKVQLKNTNWVFVVLGNSLPVSE